MHTLDGQQNRIIKRQVLTFLLFLFVYYSVTNNPIVKPAAITIQGKWSIEKAQSPLLFGLASHNYLILRDSENLVQKELHGTPTEINGTFVRVALTKGKLLKVLELSQPLDGDRTYRPSGITVLTGEEDIIRKKWDEGKRCGEDINKKELPYPAFGIDFEEDTVNSNSVATTLLTCMNLPSPKVGLLTPGSQNIIVK